MVGVETFTGVFYEAFDDDLEEMGGGWAGFEHNLEEIGGAVDLSCVVFLAGLVFVVESNVSEKFVVLEGTQRNI